MQVETELFLSPLAPRFPKTTWTRKLEKTKDGWRLELAPKSPSINAVSGTFLKPALTRIDLAVGRNWVPTGATLGLDQGPIKEDGKVSFEFVDFAGKKRIEKIRSTLTSANLAIHPILRFQFAKHRGFLLIDRIVFGVPPGDLSPTLGRVMAGMSSPSALLFSDYKVKGKKKGKSKGKGK